MKQLSSNEIFARLKEAVSDGGSAGLWLGNAYVSWYRGGDARRIDLRGFELLDSQNRLLFTEMLTLRKREGWSDDELYKLEQEVKNIMATLLTDDD